MPSTETGPVVFGVDFGMSTSSLAIIGGGAPVRLVTDPNLPAGSQHAVPTAVCLDESGRHLLVGGAAVNAKQGRPEAYRDNFKLDVKADAPPVMLGDRSFDVVDLVAAVLGFLRRRAMEEGAGEPAVTMVTVPVDWAAGRRGLITRAAIAAGFPERSLYLVDEPVAAIAHARSLDLVRDEDVVLVYDFGGGTFDSAVVLPAVTGQPQTRVSSSLRIGGHDFDQFLFQELLRRYPAQVGAVLRGPLAEAEPWRRAHLLETCETLKRRLSDYPSVRERLTDLPEAIEVELSRPELEDLIRDDVEQTLTCCEKMLDRVNLTWDGVSAVVPVGGSSRIPLVERMLATRVPGRVRLIEHRDTAVVRGAARIARDQALHNLAVSRPGPQLVDAPALWLPPAAPPEAAIVGTRTEQPFNRAWLPWLWIVLVPFLASLGGLTLTRWRDSAIVAGLAALVALAGSVRTTVTDRDSGGLASSFAPLASGGVAAISLIASIVYAYRGIVEHRPGNGTIGWWALGTAVLAGVAAIVQFGAALSRDTGRTTRAAAQQDAALTERIEPARWLGTTDAPPAFMEPLFALPALRGFELKRTTAGFQYALVAGKHVLLVAVLDAHGERPSLEAATNSWQVRLGNDGFVKAVQVVPGHRLPTLRLDELFAMSAPMTTTMAFADTVGHWLSEESTLQLRTLRPFADGVETPAPS